MSQPVFSQPDADGLVTFWCPGCQSYHGVWTQQPNPLTAAVWQWNGDRVRPSVTPSIHLHNPKVDAESRCHSYITDGRIQFLGDCTHPLAGQTVDLPPIDD